MVHLAPLAAGAIVVVGLFAAGPSSTEVAERSAQELRDLKTLSFSARARVEGSQLVWGEDKPRTVKLEQEFRVAMADGSRFRVDVIGPAKKPIRTILCDGTDIVEWEAGENVWTKYPIPSRSPNYYCGNLYLGEIEITGLRVWQFMESWVDEGSKNATTTQEIMSHPLIKPGESHQVDGRDCIVFEATERTLGFVITNTARWFFDAETFLPMGNMERRGTIGAVTGSSEYEVTFSNMRPNADLPADTFEFHPPDGARLIPPGDERFKKRAAAATSEDLDALVGKPAPRVSLPDVRGETVDVSSFAGKQPVLLVFWATWCFPCMQEMPVLEKLHADLAPHGLKLIAVSVDRSRETLDAFLKDRQLAFPVLRDPSTKARAAFGARGVPLTILIDKNGKVVRSWLGWRGRQEVGEIRAELKRLGVEVPLRD